MNKLQEFLTTRFSETKKWQYSKVVAGGRIVSMIAISDTMQVVYYLSSGQFHILESGKDSRCF